MAAEWPAVRVRDLVEAQALVVNDGYRVRNEELGPVGIPFVRGGDIGDGWIDSEPEDHIRPEFAGRVIQKLSRPGDVAFITKGTVGRVGYLRRDQPSVVFAPQVAYWRVLDRQRLDSRWIFYLLRGPEFQANLDAVKTHGAMAADYVSISQQLDFRLTIPPLPEQRAIATVLGALDDKINLNRRMNEMLDDAARALFKSWFVDFDPVRAKAEGRQPFGMDAATAALFPGGFEQTELGELPSGWRVGTLAELTASIRRGIGPAYLDTGGVLVLNQKCIRDHRISFAQARRHDPQRRDVSDRQLELGDVLVNSTGVGTLGRVAQVLRLPEPCIVDSHVTVVRPNREVYRNELLGQLLALREAEVEALGEGSTGQTELSRERLGKLGVIIPPPPVQDVLATLLSPLNRRVTAAQLETEQLATLRDYLLPKLLSGEVRVRDAEKLAEAAT